MNWLRFALGLFLVSCLVIAGRAAPVIAPIGNVTIPAGKSLILPVTATSPTGRPLSYTVTSSTNGIAVVLHTNNPFWQLTVAQAAAANAPAAYQTPFRGGLATVTNVGTMTFMLFPEYAPHTVNVFQGLTTSGFYNSNTIFHRVIAGFMIQGGDPNTNGSGGLVFRYDDEFNPQAIFSGNGQLALANSGPNTDGSQFFVTIAPYRSATNSSGDFNYTLFGQLVRGFNVLTNLNSTAVDTNSRPLAEEIIQLASFVTNTTDTVLTLTATNIPGVTGAITVIANDGAGGLVTNVFTATLVTDANSDNQPFFNPNYPNAATNLVAPVNTTLTNYISAVELDGNELYWNLEYPDQTFTDGATNSSLNISNNILKTLTYNFTNVDGLMQLFIEPNHDYVGPVNIYFLVSANSEAQLYWYFGENPPNLDYQYCTFIFGDTPIAARTNTVTVPAETAFTNLLLATFTNGVPGSAATNFTASINWGDDTISNAVITANAGGQKSVLGAHTYPYPGSYPVYVQMQSAIGASATVLSYVNVLPRPSLAFASPTNGQVMTNALAALTGAAADNQGVAGVWFQLNNGTWTVPATTNAWTNWTATLELAAGTNTVQAYALNVGGITSLTNSLSVVSSNTFKLQLALLAAKPLATNGLSFNLQLSPNLNGHLQVSTNLTSWTTLTNFTGTNATLQFLDPAATNGGRRFYRAVIP